MDPLDHRGKGQGRAGMRGRRFALQCCFALASLVPAALLIYGGAAVVLGLAPVNTGFRATLGGVEVFLQTNGAHTDLIMPVQVLDIDWRTRLPLGDIHPLDGLSDDLAFGWGDRAFYIETPAWSDFRLSTALVALSGLDTTVVHVEAVRRPYADSRTRPIHLSLAQYRRLSDFIQASLRLDGSGNPIAVPGAHYDDRDVFLEAHGHYSPINTCNEWARQGLAAAGVRVPVWSPFDKALLYQLPAQPP